MALWLRCQVPLCVAFESVAVAAEKRGGGATWGEAMKTARGMHEGYALIKGLGYQVYPKSKVRLNGLPNFLVALIFWIFTRVKSMRELLATGERECRALVDVMLAAAPKANPPVQLSMIQAMKPYYRLEKEHDATYAININKVTKRDLG